MKQNEEVVEELTRHHKKELNQCKLQISNYKKMYKEKERKLNVKYETLFHQLQVLEEDKHLYTEKNDSQSSLLKDFMEQVVELQCEITHIGESQNETTLLLREKEECLEKERMKRKDVENKYKAMLREKARDEVQRKRLPLTNQENQPSVEYLVTNEKYETQDAIKDYEKAMKRSADNIERLTNDVHMSRRLKRNVPR